MANIMNMFPGGGGAEVMSGTAVYVSSAAGMSIPNVPRMPQMILCRNLIAGIKFGTAFMLFDYDDAQYNSRIGWDFDGSNPISNITPVVVSYTNNTLTLKSGGTRFTTDSTWNYELAF